jgi:SAM-dependent methyltransferase
MAGRDYWLSIAESSDPDDLREHILTGFKNGKPFTPYVPTIPLPSSLGRVLDFGCGVGRSFPFLKTIANHVTGFDLPPMIARCRLLATDPADELIDDWEQARAQRFDLIACVLVLQHLEPATCRAYLQDFARMAPAVYLLTRADSDFGTNVLEEVSATGLYEVNDCVEVEHDPETNQLRVLGRVPFDTARSANMSGHFETQICARI